MTTGDIATWVIFAVIMIGFLFGLKRIYHNFSSGKCDSCGSGSSCSGSCHCSGCHISQTNKSSK